MPSSPSRNTLVFCSPDDDGGCLLETRSDPALDNMTVDRDLSKTNDEDIVNTQISTDSKIEIKSVDLEFEHTNRTRDSPSNDNGTCIVKRYSIYYIQQTTFINIIFTQT